MEESNEKPGYASLRRFRQSKAGSTYFITTNLAERGNGLEVQDMRARLYAEWQQLERQGSWLVRSAVVMPDHIHLLAQLGGSDSLVACMRTFKGRFAPALRLHGLKWQEGFYEHQLRESEDVLSVFLYIYLNPYRAGLLPSDQKWPGYYCCSEDWQWFDAMTRESVPQPEWLR